jgi:hypothetical protein
MFLYVIGHNQKFRVMHITFRRSIETISRYFNQVLYATRELRQEMVKPPSGETPSKIRHIKRWYPYLKVSYNFHLHNLFKLCSAHVLAGWEGSAHDASILNHSLNRPNGIQLSEGKFYLEDAGYACWPGILPLFRKTRYHLNEFSPRNRP